MATSKNSKKGSPKKETIIPKRVKERKKYILVEITPETYKKLKAGEDLSAYDEGKGIPPKQILDVITRYGKPYIKLLNE